MIQEVTREKIKGYLEAFIQKMINEHKKKSNLKATDLRPTLDHSTKGEIKPFHEALIPHGIMLMSEFERTFSTTLGSTFEEAAKLIALDYHGRAERGKRLSGEVTTKSIDEIERIKNAINKSGMKRSYLDLVDEIVSSSKSGKTEPRLVISDLYVHDNKGKEIYFEIKSPKPNKGQCLEVTERLLHIHAIRRVNQRSVRTYFAMAYNPYGNSKSEYKHSFSMKYLDLENEVVIGREFWDLIGGPGTYEEVLSIYREVGKEKGPDMLDQLALSY